jgi:hypothetical protein
MLQNQMLPSECVLGGGLITYSFALGELDSETSSKSGTALLRH